MFGLLALESYPLLAMFLKSYAIIKQYNSEWKKVSKMKI